MTDVITFKVIISKKNRGLGIARRVSIKNCTNELVAIMDADDISMHTRFEKQLNAFVEDSKLSAVGGQITEFIGTAENISGIRKVPLEHKNICIFMKKRCPFNHMTVMFKKSDVEKSGGYKNWYCNEDYYLWLRMMQKNCRFKNLPDVLVNVRVGDEMSARRGGMKYFLSEYRLQKYMLQKHIISVPRYMYNVLLRFGGEVIASNKLRVKLFKFFRVKVREEEKEILRQNVVENRKQVYSKREKLPSFSVVMSVYEKDNAEWFDTAVASILNQTVKPNEIVLVVDGPVPDSLNKVIEKYKSLCRINENGRGRNSELKETFI